MRSKQETAPPKTIDEYLTPLPENVQIALENLRETIRSVAPEAEETISYMIPTFKYRGISLVGFAAFKNHLGFYVMDPHLLDGFKNDLKLFKSAGSTVHFQPEKPLPEDLVARLVRIRMAENEERARQRLEKKSKP